MKHLAWVAALGAAMVLSGCPDDDDDTTTTDTSVADTMVGDTTVGDTGESDTAEADTSVLDDTTETDTAEADTAETDTTETDTVETDTTETDTVEGDTTGDVADTTDTGPECTGPCDCDQGFACVDGACSLGSDPVFCCTQDGCTEGNACVNADDSVGLCGVETSASFGVVVINEILTDGATDGDANGDGDSADPVGDEFVELVNTGGTAVDIGGWTLRDGNLPTARHTFAENTMIEAGKAIVVFGGGTAPDDTAGATFFVANAADPGTPLGLALNNDGDTLRLLDGEDKLVAIFDYGDGAPLAALSDQSYTRSPDLTGDFEAHSTAAGDVESIFSPGTQLDGSDF